MDTREKILDLAAAIRVAESWRSAGTRWTLAAGTFDILTPELVRGLGSVAGPVMAAALEAPDAVLPLRARVEMAAALRMVDYVLLLDGASLDEALAALQPDALIRAAERTDALIAHAHSRRKS